MSPNRLALAIVVGPIAALVNQAVSYAGTVSACGHPAQGVVHVVPAACLLVAVIAGGFGARTYRETSADQPLDAISQRRTRFMAASAMGAATLSAAIVIAQWAGITVFTPCLRS